MESIRESGDIEQDAHNVVILNKDYAEVVKAREGCELSQKMAVNAVKQFVFWKTREYGPTTEDDDKTNGREKKTMEKKGLIDSRDRFKQMIPDSKDTHTND